MAIPVGRRLSFQPIRTYSYPSMIADCPRAAQAILVGERVLS